MHTYSGSDGSLTALRSIPSADSSNGIAPAELYRAVPVRPCSTTAEQFRQGSTALPPPELEAKSESSHSPHQTARCSWLALRIAFLLPDLSMLSIILLALSGVMGLAYSSAIVHTLIRERPLAFPRALEFSGLLLVR